MRKHVKPFWPSSNKDGPVEKIASRYQKKLQYLRRNLGHIEQLLTHWPEGVELPLPRQQHLPGDEPIDPGKDLFCAL